MSTNYRRTIALANMVGALSLLGAGCASKADDLSNNNTPANPAAPTQTGGATATSTVAACTADYSTAMRNAALALTGDLPEWAAIKALMAATDSDSQKAAYEAYIDSAIASPKFAVQQIRFFRNMFATGPVMMKKNNNNGMTQYMPNYNCAAYNAARMVVEERPYTTLFTAKSDTCPTFDETSGTFTSGNTLDDTGNAIDAVGVLNDPAIMANYASNMAMRRVRFVQETFACSKMPAESGGTQVPMGSALYTSPWPFTSVTGGATTGADAVRVNFQDTSAVICANCHTTMNHQAPLFANYSLTTGLIQTSIQVKVPIQGTPTAELKDWLPDGEQTSWRFGKPTATLTDFGKAMAEDPDVVRCAVTREWNYAFARGDVVHDLATIPTDVTDAHVQSFTKNNYSVKKLIREIFTSSDYVAR